MNTFARIAVIRLFGYACIQAESHTTEFRTIELLKLVE